MSISEAELKRNVHKYLILAAERDIYVTVDGKVIAKLSKPTEDNDNIGSIKSIFGILPNDINLDDIKAERLASI